MPRSRHPESMKTASGWVILVEQKMVSLQFPFPRNRRPYAFASYDSATDRNIVNMVQREFNGLGQLITEWQAHGDKVIGTTPKVQYAYS